VVDEGILSYNFKLDSCLLKPFLKLRMKKNEFKKWIQKSHQEVYLFLPPGFVLLSADYSQIEMRIFGSFQVKIPNSFPSFVKGGDVFFKISDEEEVSETDRSITKKICFGIIYGQGICITFSKFGNFPSGELFDWNHSLFEKFPKLNQFCEPISWKCVEKIVHSLCGRKIEFNTDLIISHQKREGGGGKLENQVKEGKGGDIKNALNFLLSIFFFRSSSSTCHPKNQK